MIHAFNICGVEVKTGDIICTTDGGADFKAGEFWRLIGKLIPGEVDHIVVYTGPEKRCVESGPCGVIQFEADPEWNAGVMNEKRGRLIDTFYGIAYPLSGRGFSGEQEKKIREAVAAYCLCQANEKKPYNLNFMNTETEDAFYCSQLAYTAYLKQGIDLNTGEGVLNIPFSEKIIYPQEIWDGCDNTKAVK